MGKGNSLMCFSVDQAAFPVAANSPYFSKVVAAAVVRQLHTLDFIAAPASGNEFGLFHSVIPVWYGDNGIDVIIHWTSSANMTGNVVLGADFEIMAEGYVITSDNFFGAQTTTFTNDSEDDDEMRVTTISFTSAQTDDISAKDIFRLKVYRDTDAGGDTEPGIVKLHQIELREGT